MVINLQIEEVLTAYAENSGIYLDALEKNKYD